MCGEHGQRPKTIVDVTAHPMFVAHARVSATSIMIYLKRSKITDVAHNHGKGVNNEPETKQI